MNIYLFHPERFQVSVRLRLKVCAYFISEMVLTGSTTMCYCQTPVIMLNGNAGEINLEHLSSHFQY